LTGATPLAWRLRQDLDLLQTEAENQAAALGKSWIDKIELSCHAPVTVPNLSSPAGAVPIEELRRLMTEVAQEDAYRAEVEAR